MSRVEKRQSKSAARALKRKRKHRSPIEWFKGLKKWQKGLLIAAVVVIVAVAVVAVAALTYVNNLVTDMYEETPEEYDLSLNNVEGYINILLLGVDSRDMEDLEGTRSDAIMVISINEETNEVRLISVYRDTYLKIGDDGTYDKITHACAYGGPELTMKTLNQVMDLDISNYVMVNFKAVADLVDAVGGITVDVEDYEISQLNKYTIQTAQNIGRDSYNLVTEAGSQLLDGCQAVSYSRIRKGVGDDYKRTERMRTVLTLVFNEMKGMPFSDIREIIDMMTPQVKTNLNTSDVISLALRLASLNIGGSVGWPYDVTSGYLNGVSYVFPVNLAENTMRLHEEMFDQEGYEVSDTVLAISAEIDARIQSARDNYEIENETAVNNTETKDPTQITVSKNEEDEDTEVTDSGGGSEDNYAGSGESTKTENSGSSTAETAPSEEGSGGSSGSGSSGGSSGNSGSSVDESGNTEDETGGGESTDNQDSGAEDAADQPAPQNDGDTEGEENDTPGT